MRDKTQDDRYFVLTLLAVAKELEDTGRYSPVEQIQLAVGLPPEHYGVLKDKFARYFKRDGIIKFVYKDKPYSIMIDKVMVFPQAYAAVVPKSSMVVNMLRVFVVDIGGESLLLRPFLEASPLVVKADFVVSLNANALGHGKSSGFRTHTGIVYADDRA